MLKYRHEVLNVWPRGVAKTKPEDRKDSPFRSGWTDTLVLLERELEKLEAHTDRTRIKTFHRQAVVRRDGQLRSDAPQPPNPGVIICFDVFKWNGTYNDEGARLGKYVPVQFECDRFTHWKDSVRAIALALEAMRKIERYGVARASVIEIGRKALPAAYTGPGLTVDEACEVLARFSGFSVDHLTMESARAKEAYREAMKRTHPDRGGNADDAAKVNVAYEVLKSHLGLNGP